MGAPWPPPATAKPCGCGSRPHPLSTLTGHTGSVSGVAFRSDGHILATASYDGTARLWDISDPRRPHSQSTLTGHTNGVRSVAFSPDGHTLATASADTTTQLWDVNEPHQPHLVGTLTGHTDTVWLVAFSPDGHSLATASADNTARLWETNVENVAARICDIAWPAVSKSEWDQYLLGLPYQPPCPQATQSAGRR
ncbi:MAG: WD40 repeat domain-containing protein [Pseudonocardiaceae bacterium]